MKYQEMIVIIIRLKVNVAHAIAHSS